MQVKINYVGGDNSIFAGVTSITEKSFDDSPKVTIYYLYSDVGLLYSVNKAQVVSIKIK